METNIKEALAVLSEHAATTGNSFLITPSSSKNIKTIFINGRLFDLYGSAALDNFSITFDDPYPPTIHVSYYGWERSPDVVGGRECQR